jgi:hypothetical protein
VAISVAGFAIDAGWRSSPGLRLWSLAIGVGSAGAALSTRRWWIVVGLLVALAHWPANPPRQPTSGAVAIE